MAKPTVAERCDKLREIHLLAGLPPRSLQRILKIANEVEVPAGQVMVQPQMEGSGLFVIEEGTVVVERSGVKIELGPGSFFGELALLTPSAVRTARVRAKTDVRCLAIARYDFRKLLEQDPKFALSMLEAIAERLVDLTH
ncbi:MAG: Crp/Fnr family transcriptional regulator [Actinomycetota bacterium]|nr:cyclic nucleotide-binding domain-containing protein [Actinomycetota bacterium]